MQSSGHSFGQSYSINSSGPSSLSTDAEPIAALATGDSAGAIAVIRISGKDLSPKVSVLLNLKSSLVPRRMTRATVILPESGDVIDDVLLAYFPAPHSFTGEDVIEINCHGGRYIILEILRQLARLGIRQALPGEFTKRALLNGKIDLTQAEGIKDLVEASTRQEWLSGRQLYSGRLRRLMDALRSSLVEAMAWLEAMIDFPDEGDTASVDMAQVLPRVKSVSTEIEKLLSTFASGHVASQGLRVAMVGQPNAGKSTLLNLLLGKDRAIVSEIPGTTRDYIEEKCLIDGRLVRLVDTAGLRVTSETIESIGIERTKEILIDCDIVMLLLPVDASDDDIINLRDDVLNLLRDKSPNLTRVTEKVLCVVTKTDLNLPIERITKHVSSWDVIEISCKDERGIEGLKACLSSRVDQFVDRLGGDPFLTSERQKEALTQAQKCLDRFYDLTNRGAGPELCAFELLEASRSLAAVVGGVSNDDVLDKVFREFCIGK